jgi:hypothetical protein
VIASGGSLRELQTTLEGLFRRTDPIAGEVALEPTAVAIATGNDRVSPAEQLDIYRRQYWLRHIDSLTEDFPGLAGVLGEDAFDAFLRAYLEACPPHDPSLRELPFDAPLFAAGWDGFPPGRAGLARAMIDYELAFVDVFDGPEPAPLDPQRIAAIPPEGWETARLVLSPIVKRLALDFPVHTLRYAIRAGESPALPEVPAPVHLLLFRKADVVHYEELAPDASRLLEILGRGVALVPACAELTAGLSEAEVARIGGQVGGWFQRFAQLGVFADVELPPAAS